MARSQRWILMLLVAAVAVAAVLWGMRPARARLEDGTYQGRTEADERGTYGQIELTIDQGKIKEANYDEIQADGTPKTEEYQYETYWPAQANYEEQLVEKQDPDEVEVISGATGTYNKFKEAAKKALEQAQ